MDRFIQLSNSGENVTYNIFFPLLLLYYVHFKFFAQTVIGVESIIVDIMFYGLLFLGIDYKRIRYFILIFVLVIPICMIIPAAKNMFAIFVTTCIIAQLPLKKILFHNIIAQLIIFALSSFCIFIGIIEPKMFEITDIDGRIRWDYGMGNPNTFALFAYSFLINLYLILDTNKKTYMVLFLITMLVSLYTGSRTFLISMIVLLFLSNIKISKTTHIKVIKNILRTFPVLIIFLIFYLSHNVESYNELNLLLSGRLTLYNSLLSSVSYKEYFLGTTLVNELTIDSSFLHLVFEGGVIPFAIFFYLYFKYVANICIENIGKTLPLLSSILLFSLTESVLTFLLIYGNMIIWILMYKNILNIRQRIVL